jgi:hypothetical protein
MGLDLRESNGNKRMRYGYINCRKATVNPPAENCY